jgi:hypothetical protein
LNALPNTKVLTEGDRVVSSDGKELGLVKELKPDRFKVDVRWAPDYWLGTEVVDSAEQGIVQLIITKEGVGPAKIHSDNIDDSSLPSNQKPDTRSF